MQPDHYRLGPWNQSHSVPTAGAGASSESSSGVGGGTTGGDLTSVVILMPDGRSKNSSSSSSGADGVGSGGDLSQQQQQQQQQQQRQSHQPMMASAPRQAIAWSPSALYAADTGCCTGSSSSSSSSSSSAGGGCGSWVFNTRADVPSLRAHSSRAIAGFKLSSRRSSPPSARKVFLKAPQQQQHSGGSTATASRGGSGGDGNCTYTDEEEWLIPPVRSPAPGGLPGYSESSPLLVAVQNCHRAVLGGSVWSRRVCEARHVLQRSRPSSSSIKRSSAAATATPTTAAANNTVGTAERTSVALANLDPDIIQGVCEAMNRPAVFGQGGSGGGGGSSSSKNCSMSGKPCRLQTARPAARPIYYS